MADIVSADWDSVRKVAAFSINGVNSSQPNSTPRIFPGTGVLAAGTQTLNIEVVNNGTTVEVGGAPFLQLATGSLILTPPTSGVGKAVLSGTIQYEGLSPALFSLLVGRGQISTLDVVAADNSGLASGVALTQAVETATGHSDPSDVTIGATGNVAGAVSTSLTAGQVLSGEPVSDTYVRIVLASGDTLTVDGEQYFDLLGESQTSTPMASGTASLAFGVLSLSLGGGVANQLLTALGKGTAVTEVDVLTYSNTGTTGAEVLTQEQSYGLGKVTGLAIGTGGALDLSIQFDTVRDALLNSAGTAVASSVAYNTVNNTATYDGPAPTLGPALSTSLGLPAGGVATDATYLARLVNSSGSVVNIGGQTLFEITGLQYGAGLSGAATFSPLGLTFTDPALDTSLLTAVLNSTTLQQIDVLGYLPASGGTHELFSDTSFGTVLGSTLDVGAVGTVTYRAVFGSLAMTSYSQTNTGSLVADTSGTWDVLNNSTTFDIASGTPGTAYVGPTLEPTTGVNAQGADNAAYYLRLVNTSGNVVTIGGDQLFALDGSAYGATISAILNGEGAKPTLSNLQLGLSDSSLGAYLYGDTVAATSFDEIDVLGYDKTTGKLLSDASFGGAATSTVTLDAAGQPTFTASYAALEVQQYSTNSVGALTLDPVAKWDATTSTPTFSNGAGTAPVAAPGTLPTGGVDSVSGTVEYLARFVTASGTTLSLDGQQFFPLSDYTAGTELVGSHVAFGALGLGFAQPGLAALLFGNVSQVAGFAEIDVVGYDQGSGALISEASYGAAIGVGLTNDIAGTTQASFAYDGSEVQNFTAGTATAQFAYDLATRTGIFSTSSTGSPSSQPAAVPTTLPTAAATPPQIDYYARFVTTTGTTLTADGAQLFALDGATYATTANSSTKVSTLDPLTLSLGQSPLVQPLLALLDGNTSIAEVDLLGYQHSNGLLVQETSFGAADIGSVTLNAAGVAQYVVDYSTEAMQYGAAGLTADPGPSVAVGSLLAGHGQTSTITGLLDGLITPGLSGDTESIVGVTGHATLSAGIVTYTAPASGPDSFTFAVQDEIGNTATGTVHVTIDPGPAATTGSLAIVAGQSEAVTSLIDSLVTPGLSSDTFAITAVTGHASLAAGAVTYTAPATPGPDSFTYTVTDELGDIATGTVDVFVEPLCFCAGTRIATPTGEVQVETLRPGDLVRLADGGIAPVLWLGRRIVRAESADPLLALPVRFAAGALGEGLPARDLLLSPCHALRLGDILVHSGALVNGSSIARVEPAWPFAYYHVELAVHALLLAEGVAAESFLDTAKTLAFDNEAERGPRVVRQELPYPRVKSARQVPSWVRRRLAASRLSLSFT